MKKMIIPIHVLITFVTFSLFSKDPGMRTQFSRHVIAKDYLKKTKVPKEQIMNPVPVVAPEELLARFSDAIDKGTVNIEDPVDQFKNTPLMMAAAEGNIKLAELLLQKGAHVNTTNSVGSSALLLATIQGFQDIVQLLVANGADVTLVNKVGMSPLLYAIDSNNQEILQILIDNGADANTMDKESGITALMLASELGNIEAVKLLLEHGALIDTKNKEGATALDLATKEGHTAIVELLKSKAST